MPGALCGTYCGTRAHSPGPGRPVHALSRACRSASCRRLVPEGRLNLGVRDARVYRPLPAAIPQRMQRQPRHVYSRTGPTPVAGPRVAERCGHGGRYPRPPLFADDDHVIRACRFRPANVQSEGSRREVGTRAFGSLSRGRSFSTRRRKGAIYRSARCSRIERPRSAGGSNRPASDLAGHTGGASILGLAQCLQ